MQTFLKFIKDNKKIVTIASSVTMVLFLAFTAVAVIAGTKGTDDKKEAEVKEETAKVAEKETSKKNHKDDTDEDESENESEDIELEEKIDPNTLPYMIKVNRAANCLTVYAKSSNGDFSVPVKAITVSCGKNFGDTPVGDFQTIISYNWRLMVDNTYAQHAYRIVGSILFHSVPYVSRSKDSLEWEEYNKLGTPASLGCVRMTVADAKWLVDNCPVGTRVVIYDDASNPGPLGKPETIKIPADSPYRGWDPTDPDPANPWSNFYATIQYPSSGVIEVKPGTPVEDLYKCFKAFDTCGNDITSKIQFSGNFDLNTAGTYEIMVSVIDAIGSNAEINITLNVRNEEQTTTAPEPTTEPESSAPEETTTENNESSESSSETTSGESPSEEETTTQDSSGEGI